MSLSPRIKACKDSESERRRETEKGHGIGRRKQWLSAPQWVSVEFNKTKLKSESQTIKQERFGTGS